MQAILALEIDGSDVTPIGVFPDIQSARDGILEQEKARGREATDYAFDVTDFLDNLRDADNIALTPGHVDMQFESGFGSWDIRLVTVEVSV
jgi:hypothetical protein